MQIRNGNNIETKNECIFRGDTIGTQIGSVIAQLLAMPWIKEETNLFKRLAQPGLYEDQYKKFEPEICIYKVLESPNECSTQILSSALTLLNCAANALNIKWRDENPMPSYTNDKDFQRQLYLYRIRQNEKYFPIFYLEENKLYMKNFSRDQDRIRLQLQKLIEVSNELISRNNPYPNDTSFLKFQECPTIEFINDLQTKGKVKPPNWAEDGLNVKVFLCCCYNADLRLLDLVLKKYNFLSDQKFLIFNEPFKGYVDEVNVGPYLIRKPRWFRKDYASYLIIHNDSSNTIGKLMNAITEEFTIKLLAANQHLSNHLYNFFSSNTNGQAMSRPLCSLIAGYAGEGEDFNELPKLPYLDQEPAEEKPSLFQSLSDHCVVM